MTPQTLLDDLRRMTPTQRHTVLACAKTIRTAREAGDQRPAVMICAPLLAFTRRTEDSLILSTV